MIQRAYNKYGQIEKPSVEDVPKTKVNNPKVLDEPEPYRGPVDDFGKTQCGEGVTDPRYIKEGYKSGPRSNNLFLKDNAKKTINVTDWSRSFNKADIANERRLFLGEDCVKIAPGKWRSLDGTRQFRVKPDDYLGIHGIGMPEVPNTPHIHLELLKLNASGSKFKVVKNIHVPLK